MAYRSPGFRRNAGIFRRTQTKRKDMHHQRDQGGSNPTNGNSTRTDNSQFLIPTRKQKKRTILHNNSPSTKHLTKFIISEASSLPSKKYVWSKYQHLGWYNNFLIMCYGPFQLSQGEVECCQTNFVSFRVFVTIDKRTSLVE